jgi:hypothetical protein
MVRFIKHIFSRDFLYLLPHLTIPFHLLGREEERGKFEIRFLPFIRKW